MKLRAIYLAMDYDKVITFDLLTATFAEDKRSAYCYFHDTFLVLCDKSPQWASIFARTHLQMRSGQEYNTKPPFWGGSVLHSTREIVEKTLILYFTFFPESIQGITSFGSNSISFIDMLFIPRKFTILFLKFEHCILRHLTVLCVRFADKESKFL